MSLKIEHDIPLPDYIRGEYKKTFAKMSKGDSFTVEDRKGQTGALMAARRGGYVAASQKLDGNGYRVWLVAKKRKMK